MPECDDATSAADAAEMPASSTAAANAIVVCVFMAIFSLRNDRPVEQTRRAGGAFRYIAFMWRGAASRGARKCDNS